MDLEGHKKALNGLGWFIPPYLSVGFLGMLKDAIENGQLSNQNQLEVCLSQAYSPVHLAAMVTERYAATPIIQEYRTIIGEAVEAHFFGLRHAAVSGLLPVIEGAGRKLAQSRSVPVTSIKSVFANLTADCKLETVQRDLGVVDEILTMMDSFVEFTDKFLYENSASYPLSDNTNRHGMLHGAYSDGDYGAPINFYKAIGSVDFLCMVAAFRSSVSWLAPDPTPASTRLCAYYVAGAALARLRPI